MYFESVLSGSHLLKIIPSFYNYLVTLLSDRFSASKPTLHYINIAIQHFYWLVVSGIHFKILFTFKWEYAFWDIVCKQHIFCYFIPPNNQFLLSGGFFQLICTVITNIFPLTAAICFCAFYLFSLFHVFFLQLLYLFFRLNIFSCSTSLLY